MLKALAEYVMRGRIPAAGVAGLLGALSWVMPPLSYISGAIVALVSLRQGMKEGFIVIGGATLLTGIVSMGGFGSPLPTISLAILLWIPACLLAQVLRSSESQGLMITVCGAIAAIFTIGMRWSTDKVELWWKSWLEGLFKSSNLSDNPALTPENLNNVAEMMNGIVGLAIVISLGVILLIARNWQSQLYNPEGFRPEFYTLAIPRSLAYLACGVLLLAIYQTLGSESRWATDLVFIATACFFFQGLAVSHYLIAAKGWSKWYLGGLYFSVFALPQIVIVLLALLGLIDSLRDLRGLGNQQIITFND